MDRGPYSVSRNPLYVFSFIGAFGMGAQTGSVLMSCLFTLIAFLVFYATVRREEDWLKATFGAGLRGLYGENASVLAPLQQMA